MTGDSSPLIFFPGEPHEMVFRWIPPGRFCMGSRGYLANEEPRHWVEITQGLWMGETPVTQAQYRFLAGRCADELAMVEGNPGSEPSEFEGRDDHPVESVNWHEAQVIAAWLTRSGELRDPSLHAHLPTEAQWEYACRAGTSTEYHSGDGFAALTEVGWFGEDLKSGSTHLVKSKGKGNAFGLYDMHGNVWEWCLDAYGEEAHRKRGFEARDPFVDGESDAPRVMRGGSWFLTAGFCRSAHRYGDHPGCRFWIQGFRLCVSSGAGITSQRGAGTAQKAQLAEGAGGGGADDRATGIPATGATWQGMTPPRSGGDFLPEN